MTRPHRTRSRRLAAAVVALLLTGATAACGDDTSTSDDASDGPPTITIVTYSSYVLDDDVRTKIEDDLGVKLEIKANGDGAEALSAAVLTAGRPEGDVFFGVDNTLLTRALDGKVFAEVSPDDLPGLAKIPKDLQLDATGHLVPVDVGPVCVDYDRQWFTDKGLAPPTSLADLAKPEYRDLLVVESPVTSSTGLVFLMAVHAALGDGASDYLQSLVDNGASVAGSWDDAWGAQYTVSGGDRPLVVSYASSPPAEVVYSEGKVTTPRTGVIEGTCADQVEFAGVMDGTDHPDEATKVLDAMLGEEYQASLPLTNFVYPAREGVAVPDVFAQFAPRPASSIALDPRAISEHRDAWIDEWRSIAE